jgi:2-hydroxycyclohexanecarboxyl-CoA dehydrogenase
VTTAFVTGAGRGIGRAIALRLAKAGLAIGVTDLDGGTAAAVAGEIQAAGGRATSVVADVTSSESMRAAVAAVEGALGPIDVLVNNAGWDEFHFFAETEPAFWDKVIAINYRGVLATTHAVLAGMTARKRGRIVSIASDAGRVGSTGESVYSGCKGAVIAFSKALAREVARYGITVNCVAPGVTDTQLLHDVMAGDRGARILEAVKRTVPLGRLGTPEDVAGTVAYLVSDEAGYMTGQVVSISGGLTMS